MSKPFPGKRTATRIHPTHVVEAFFNKSQYILPGVNVWGTLDFESKQRFRSFIDQAKVNKPKNVSAAERLAYFVNAMLPDLDLAIATRWGQIEDRKNLLKPAFLANMARTLEGFLVFKS
jgi:hypothetical protein